MEAWLKSNTDSFKFPYVPQMLPVNKSYNIHTESLANGDEISFYGGENLKRTTISAHFPIDVERTYLDDKSILSPQECVQKIEHIAKSDGEIRYIVTETEINMPVKILNFDRQIQDATGDIHFTLSMVEYNPPKPKAWTPPPPPPTIEEKKKVEVNKKSIKAANQTKSVKRAVSTNANNNKNVQLKGRPNNRKVPKYYKVKKKQNVYDIAYKTTGNPKMYKGIIHINTNPYIKKLPTVFKDMYTIKIPPKNYQPKQNPYKNFYNQITSKNKVNQGNSMVKWMKGL